VIVRVPRPRGRYCAAGVFTASPLLTEAGLLVFAALGRTSVPRSRWISGAKEYAM